MSASEKVSSAQYLVKLLIDAPITSVSSAIKDINPLDERSGLRPNQMSAELERLARLVGGTNLLWQEQPTAGRVTVD